MIKGGGKSPLVYKMIGVSLRGCGASHTSGTTSLPTLIGRGLCSACESYTSILSYLCPGSQSVCCGPCLQAMNHVHVSMAMHQPQQILIGFHMFSLAANQGLLWVVHGLPGTWPESHASQYGHAPPEAKPDWLLHLSKISPSRATQLLMWPPMKNRVGHP